MLKNMRINARHRNMEFKIIGLSEKPCNQQWYVLVYSKNLFPDSSHLKNILTFTCLASSFPMKLKCGDNGTSEEQTVEITVYEYFTKHCGVEITSSQYMPCLDVGKPKRPNYLPLEVCKFLLVIISFFLRLLVYLLLTPLSEILICASLWGFSWCFSFVH